MAALLPVRIGVPSRSRGRVAMLRESESAGTFLSRGKPKPILCLVFDHPITNK